MIVGECLQCGWCCRNYPIERDLKFDKNPSCGYRLEEEGNES